MPFTVTFALCPLAGIVTEAGTVATAVLSEMSVTFSGLSVFAGRLSVTICDPPGPSAISCGVKASDAVTFTAPVPGANPVAEAVMVALPGLMPVTWGCVAGAVAPAAMVTEFGETLTTELSLLDRLTVTGEIAGAARLIANCTD